MHGGTATGISIARHINRDAAGSFIHAVAGAVELDASRSGRKQLRRDKVWELRSGACEERTITGRVKLLDRFTQKIRSVEITFKIEGQPDRTVQSRVRELGRHSAAVELLDRAIAVVCGEQNSVYVKCQSYRIRQSSRSERRWISP